MSRTQGKSAAVRLAEMLEEEALGERALKTILKREGYDAKEISEAVSRIDWDAQAERAGEQDESAVSVPMLLFTSLKARGFTPEQASRVAYGTDNPEDQDTFSVESALWDEVAAMGADHIAAVQQVFGDTADSLDEAEVEAALNGDLRARCRVMAASLLDTGISRAAMQQSLTEAGFSAQLVREQIRDLKPNWKTQACVFAEQAALELQDPEEIQEALREAGFTPVQVAYAMNRAHIRDDKAAVAAAHHYIDVYGRSGADLRSYLRDCNFTPEQVKLAAQSVNADARDWIETGAAVLRGILADPEEIIHGEPAFRKEMRSDGYTKDQLDAAVEGIDWAERALMDYTESIHTGGLDAQFVAKTKVKRQLQELGYPARVAKEAVERFYSDYNEREAALLAARLTAEALGSPQSLRAQLTANEFKQEDIDWIMDRVFIDPLAGARTTWEIELGRLVLAGIFPSPQDMRSVLADAGFEADVIEEIVAEASDYWHDTAGMYAMNLRAEEISENEIRAEMAEEKFPLDAVEEAIVGTRGVSPEEAAGMIRAAGLIIQLENLQHRMESAMSRGPGLQARLAIAECTIEMHDIILELEELGVSMDGFGDLDF